MCGSLRTSWRSALEVDTLNRGSAVKSGGALWTFAYHKRRWHSTRAVLGMQFSRKLLDEIRARVPVSQVVSRKVALKRAGREMKGLSPFKQERTPSFFVNDHKGSWFDFSSGQNGDIFKLV